MPKQREVSMAAEVIPLPQVSPEITPAGLPPTRSLVASASTYNTKTGPRVFVSADKTWQHEVYRHISICGEARFACNFYANSVSLATLSIKNHTTEGDVAVTSGEAVDALNDLTSGAEGAEEMLKAIGYHLAAAGECYLIGRRTDPAVEAGVDKAGDIWEVVSVMEVRAANGEWSIVYEGHTPIPLPDGTSTVIRIWNPDPAKKQRADSPMKSLLPVLREIEWATRHVFAQTTSRLAGAGILLMSNEVDLPTPPDNSGLPATATTADILMYMLAQAMEASIAREGAPESLIPIVLQVPPGAVDKIKLLEFWSKLDEKVLEMRTQAINRFALGMDLPAEQVLGMSSNSGTGGGNSNGVSHWGAWQIEEQTIKLFIEPALRVATHAMSYGFLQTQPGVEPTEYIAYSTERLRLRPDRSKESLELHERGLLKGEVAITENGFSTTQMPDDDELKKLILWKMATGSATPQMVAMAAQTYGLSVPVPTTDSQPGEVRETPQPPTLEDHPTKPRTPAEAAALLPAYEALVLRALERAGNRIRQTLATKPEGVRAVEMHCINKVDSPRPFLADAWSSAPTVLSGYVEDVEGVISTLDAYCSRTIMSQVPHTRERLAAYLQEAAA